MWAKPYLTQPYNYAIDFAKIRKSLWTLWCFCIIFGGLMKYVNVYPYWYNTIRIISNTATWLNIFTKGLKPTNKDRSSRFCFVYSFLFFTKVFTHDYFLLPFFLVVTKFLQRNTSAHLKNKIKWLIGNQNKKKENQNI